MGAIKVVVAAFVLVLYGVALRKDLKNRTEEQRQRPIVFMVELLPVLGLVSFLVGWVIFRHVVVGGSAIIICLLGFSVDTIRQWRANGVWDNVKAVVLLLMIALLFIAFIR